MRKKFSKSFMYSIKISAKLSTCATEPGRLPRASPARSPFAAGFGYDIIPGKIVVRARGAVIKSKMVILRREVHIENGIPPFLRTARSGRAVTHVKNFLERKLVMIVMSLFLAILPAFGTAEGEEAISMSMVKDIHWLGHDTFKIVGEKIIYTDPFKIKRRDTADIVLITHDHFDHCSPEDVRMIQGRNTVIVATADCAKKLTGTIKTVNPGDSITVEGIAIEAVPSYNTNKQFHPKSNNWAGYIFTVRGQRIYIAGDTDYIPEMKTFRADIALLPVSGTYVMTADEAVKAALDIKPKIAIPMHYDSIVGTADDAKKFADALKGKIEVVILKEE